MKTSMHKSLAQRDLLTVIALALFGILYAGYDLRNSYFIPIILHHAHPALYPGDLLIAGERLLHSLFFPVAGFIIRFLDLNLFLTMCHLCICVSLALLVFLLSYELFHDKVTSFIAVFLLLIPKAGISVTPFGIVFPVVEPSVMAKPFTLLALYLFLKGRYRIACLITGVMFYLQGVEAASLTVIFMFFFFLKRKAVTRALLWQSLLLLCIVPILRAPELLSSNFFAGVPQQLLREWVSIVRFRVFWHIFPFSWGIGDYFGYAAWILWAMIVYKYSPASLKQGHVTIFVAAIALWCLIGTVFVEITPMPLVIKLMPWRSTFIFVLFLVMYISRYLREFPTETLLQRLFLAATIAVLFLSLQKLILCFALLHLAWNLKSKRVLSYGLAAAGIAGCIVFSVGSLVCFQNHSLVLANVVSFLDLGYSSVALFLFAFGFFLCCILLNPRQEMWTGSRHAVWLGVFMISLLLFKHSLPDITSKGYFQRDWVKAQEWARLSTPMDAVFITPPYLEGFRINSERGVVVENKDGGIGSFDMPYAFTWWERMQDVGYKDLRTTALAYAAKARDNYVRLSASEIEALAKKYKAQYLVTERSGTVPFELVYQNESFAIYRLMK